MNSDARKATMRKTKFWSVEKVSNGHGGYQWRVTIFLKGSICQHIRFTYREAVSSAAAEARKLGLVRGAYVFKPEGPIHTDRVIKAYAKWHQDHPDVM